MRPTRPTSNPIILALTDAQAFHTRQAAALQQAIAVLRGAEGPILVASPQRARTPSGGGRPRRVFSAAARRRMSRGMRAFWKKRKAAQAAAGKAR